MTDDASKAVSSDENPSGWDQASERRSRRSVAHTQAFRAVKLRHSQHHTRMEIFANRLTEFAATTGFFVFHAIAFSIWILWNLRISPLPHFDPFPYGLLTMIVSLEAIFLALCILMTQGRESRIAELREEMTLQVILRLEEEVTKTLQLVAGVYGRMGQKLGEDPDLQEMLQPLNARQIEEDLMEQIADAIPRLGRKPSYDSTH